MSLYRVKGPCYMIVDKLQMGGYYMLSAYFIFYLCNIRIFKKQILTVPLKIPFLLTCMQMHVQCFCQAALYLIKSLQHIGRCSKFLLLQENRYSKLLVCLQTVQFHLDSLSFMRRIPADSGLKVNKKYWTLIWCFPNLK